MILAAMLLFLTPADLRLSAVDMLSPSTSGELILAGEEHGRIDSIGRNYGDVGPPGLIELQLVERPVAGREGCSRKRWIASFLQAPGTASDDAVLTSVSSVVELAVGSSDFCPSGRYAQLAPGVAWPQAFAALKQLDDIRRGRSKVEFACSDSTPSNLCADARTILIELRRIRPWAVQRQDDVTVIWLGVPGQVVTEVRLDPRTPDRIAVNRRVPAPF
ncbi:MAG: hypothetical protein JWR84_1038 [Caulobacter sp.]|nr:hypothetical protein [Caulobacter sp.]